jgi:hypothetical protein
MAVPFGDGENLQPNDRDVGRSRASRESLSAAMRRSAQVPVLQAAPQFSGHIRPTGVPRHAQRRAPLMTLLGGPAQKRTLAVGGLSVGLVATLIVLAHPLPAWCAAIAIAVRLVGSGQYAVAVARRRARPNIVTWFLWGVTPMIAVAAQVDGYLRPEVAVTFVLGLGPLVVSAVAFRTDRSASHLTPFTLSCAAASVAGIVAWQVTDNPALAIASCVLADLLASLPTLRKAYGAPESEYAPPYLLSMLAMLVTLGTIDGGDFTSYGFPLYILLINVALFAFAAMPVARIVAGTTDTERLADVVSPARPRRHGIPPGYRPAAVPAPR